MNNNLRGLPEIQALNLRLDDTTPEQTPLSSAYIHHRAGKPRGGIPNPAEARSDTVRTLHPEMSATATEGEGRRRATTNGDYGSHFSS